MQNDFIPLEAWFEPIVNFGNTYFLVPSSNGICLIRYPFIYGDVVYVQSI